MGKSFFSMVLLHNSNFFFFYILFTIHINCSTRREVVCFYCFFFTWGPSISTYLFVLIWIFLLLPSRSVGVSIWWSQFDVISFYYSIYTTSGYWPSQTQPAISDEMYSHYKKSWDVSNASDCNCLPFDLLGSQYISADCYCRALRSTWTLVTFIQLNLFRLFLMQAHLAVL